jgi:hypothetical protein
MPLGVWLRHPAVSTVLVARWYEHTLANEVTLRLPALSVDICGASPAIELEAV